MGGFFLVVAGAVMAWQSLQSGKAMARFASGPVVNGRVVSVENVGASRPDYRMSVAWTDASGAERASRTQVFQYEAEHCKPGDAIELLVAKDDPLTVMLKRIYDNEGLVSLGSTPATPLIFGGLLLLLGGFFLLATGNRFLRPAD